MRLAAFLIALALLPASAQAASQITPTGARPYSLTGSGTANPKLLGPGLVDGGVVWTERGSNSRFTLRIRDATGVRTLGSVDQGRFGLLEAAGSRIGVNVGRQYPTGPCSWARS